MPLELPLKSNKDRETKSTCYFCGKKTNELLPVAKNAANGFWMVCKTCIKQREMSQKGLYKNSSNKKVTYSSRNITSEAIRYRFRQEEKQIANNYFQQLEKTDISAELVELANNWFKISLKPVLYSEYETFMESLGCSQYQQNQLWRLVNEKRKHSIMPRLAAIEEQIIIEARKRRKSLSSCFSITVLATSIIENNPCYELKELALAAQRLVHRYQIFRQDKVSKTIEFN